VKRAWIKSIMDDAERSGDTSADMLSRADRAFAYDIVSILPSNGNGMTLLDIGSGCTARFAPLVFLNYRVFGVHPSNPAAAGLQVGLERSDGHVEVMRCGFPEEPIPARDGTFDWLVLSNLPEPHDQSIKSICAEVRRLMKPGGRMILRSHNPLSGARRGAVATDAAQSTPDGLVQACCPRLAESVERSGFRVTLRMYRNYRAYHKPILIRHVCSLARLVAPRLCDTVILVCTKR
jgi:SAM-dependent methyltransferase